MKKEELYNIWIASQEKADSSTKLIVYDAIGELIIDYDSNSFKFISETVRVQSSQILDVEYKHQTLNWKVYLLGFTTVTSFFYTTTGSLLYPIVMLSIGASIGLLSAYSFRWAKVTYKDEQERVIAVYFADGNFRGYSGMFGGNKNLYRKFLNLSGIPEWI